MINQKGQSLLEAMVALGAAALIVSAMAVAVVVAVNNSDYSKYENQATHYAQQGIEILRQASQSDWTTFADVDGSYIGNKCLKEDATVPIQISNCPLQDAQGNPADPNITPNFIRQTNLWLNNNSCGNDSLLGTVTVFWNDGKCQSGNPYCHKVKLDSCFANINPVLEL